MKVLLFKRTTQHRNKEALDNFATKREESLISKPVSRDFFECRIPDMQKKKESWIFRQITFKVKARLVFIFPAGFENVICGVFLANLSCCILLLG